MISNDKHVIKVNDIAHPLQISSSIINGVSTNDLQEFANILSLDSLTEVVHITTGGTAFLSNYLTLKLNNYSINDLYPPCNELHINSLIFKVQNTGTTSYSYSGFRILDKNSEVISTISKSISIPIVSTRYFLIKGIYSFDTSSWEVAGSITTLTALPTSVTPLSNKCVKVADLGVKIRTSEVETANNFYYKCNSVPESSVLMFNNNMPEVTTALENTSASIYLGIMLPFTKGNSNSKYFYIKKANFNIKISSTAVKYIYVRIYANSTTSYYLTKSVSGSPIVAANGFFYLTISNGLLDLETSTWVNEPTIKLN